MASWQDQPDLLYQISRRLNSDLDIERVLADVLGLTLDCVGANIGSIIVFNDQDQVEFTILARSNMPPEQADLVLSKVLSHGLAGNVVQLKKGLIVSDVSNDSRWITFNDDNVKEGSAIGVPLIRRDRVVGVITLRHNQVDYFTQAHLRLLSSVAEQSAIAIENARLFHSVQAERAKFEAIINGAGDGVLVTDSEGIVTLINPAATRVLNFQTETNLGDFSIAKHPALAVLWNDCKDGQLPCTHDVILPDQGVYQATLTMLAEIGFVIVLHDVTYLKLLDKLRSDFLSNVSHDLRSPLQLIFTYTSMLQDDETLTDTQADYLDGINRSSQKMSDLLDDLLDLTRVNAGIGMQGERCDLGPIILDVVFRFDHLAREKGIKVLSEISPDLPPVLVNAHRFDQVISNLLDNAFKYTPEGTITVQALPADEWVVIRVQDTGIGLKPEEKKQLFSSFYRAKNEYTRDIEGTGMGLAIVKSIVEQYGGIVTVSSVWQEGSAFEILLPRGEA